MHDTLLTLERKIEKKFTRGFKCYESPVFLKAGSRGVCKQS